MSVKQPNRVAYGLSDALPVMPPQPIVSKRAPLTNDMAAIGTLWINTTTSLVYVIANIVSGIATWLLLEAGGGSGAFGLLSSTGATTLATTGASVNTFGNTTGATSLSLLVGTGNFALNGVGASTYTIGAATTTGTIGIGGTAQTGTITLGSSSGTNTVAIGAGAGATTVNIANGVGGNTIALGTGAAVNTITLGGTSANVIAIGNTQTAGSISLGGAMTTGTINIGSATSGLVTVPPVVGTVASTSHAVTINARVGYFTGTGFTTAAAASEVFTVTNSTVAATSAVLATGTNFGTNDARMTVTRVIPAAGNVQIEIQNLGIAALNGNLAITFWILS